MKNEDSLIAALEGNYSGMSHADLVLTCKMLARGREIWRKEAEQLREKLEKTEALARQAKVNNDRHRRITSMNPEIKIQPPHEFVDAGPTEHPIRRSYVFHFDFGDGPKHSIAPACASCGMPPPKDANGVEQIFIAITQKDGAVVWWCPPCAQRNLTKFLRSQI